MRLVSFTVVVNPTQNTPSRDPIPSYFPVKNTDNCTILKCGVQVCSIHFTLSQAAVTHSKLISEMSTMSDNESGAHKGGSKKGGGGKRRGKGRSSQASEEREGTTEFKELQFMSIPEVCCL